MSFEVIFYTNTSENNVVDKTIQAQSRIQCNLLRDDTDILNPVIVAEYSATYVRYNYAYIAQWGRYYYVVDKHILTNSLLQFNLKVDVLMTYKALIRQQTAIILRQQQKYNLYLNDGTFSVYQDNKVVIQNFQSGFSGATPKYLLAVAGGYSPVTAEVEAVTADTETPTVTVDEETPTVTVTEETEVDNGAVG